MKKWWCPLSTLDQITVLTLTMTATSAPRKTKNTDFGYASWDKRSAELSRQLEEEEKVDRQQNASALGLDGKYARSQAEAEEGAKAVDVCKAKAVLEQYRRREDDKIQSLSGLLGASSEAGKAGEAPQEVKYVTRDSLGAGKRVIDICDTRGPGRIVLTQDLSNLECATPANATLQPKSYADDAENAEEMPAPTVHRGLIKLNLRQLSQCTVVVKCKIITGTVEISHCKDVTVIVEGDDATVATIQADLCERLNIQFLDSPSGKNVPARVRDTNSGPTTTLFWGQDVDDRIYHAGVSDLVRSPRPPFVCRASHSRSDLTTRSRSLSAWPPIATATWSSKRGRTTWRTAPGPWATPPPRRCSSSRAWWGESSRRRKC